MLNSNADSLKPLIFVQSSDVRAEAMIQYATTRRSTAQPSELSPPNVRYWPV
jgi:hypothetical protein